MRRVCRPAIHSTHLSRWCSALGTTPSQPHDSGNDVRPSAEHSGVATKHDSTTKSSTSVAVSDSPLPHVRILSLSSPPVNTLTSTVISDLLVELRRLASPESECRGVVLTSDLPATFSSGLDLNIFVKDPFEPATFAHYWAQFQELFMTMHAYPLPLVAAINGHAPAAGCIMACACDYRVMAEGPSRESGSETKPPRPFTIGVTAARAGFAAPSYVAKNLSWIVGHRVAQDMLTRGATLTAREAFDVGLVDEVVNDGGEAVVAALHEVERYLQMPMEHTRWLVKDHMRRPVVWPLRDKNTRTDDCVKFAEMLQSPIVRRDLLSYSQSLSKKKKVAK